VPIDLWKEIESEKETAHLLKSATMKKRLLEAKNRKEGIPFDEACQKLGFYHLIFIQKSSTIVCLQDYTF